MLLCVPNVVHFYDHQKSIIKHFSVDSIKSEFGNKGLNFDYSLWQTKLEIVLIWTNYARLGWIPHPFSYLKHLQATNSSFVTITKLSSNEKWKKNVKDWDEWGKLLREKCFNIEKRTPYLDTFHTVKYATRFLKTYHFIDVF